MPLGWVQRGIALWSISRGPLLEARGHVARDVRRELPALLHEQYHQKAEEAAHDFLRRLLDLGAEGTGQIAQASYRRKDLCTEGLRCAHPTSETSKDARKWLYAKIFWYDNRFFGTW